MTILKLLPTPRAEKHSPQSREDFTPNLAARIQEIPLTLSVEVLTACENQSKSKEIG